MTIHFYNHYSNDQPRHPGRMHLLDAPLHSDFPCDCTPEQARAIKQQYATGNPAITGKHANDRRPLYPLLPHPNGQPFFIVRDLIHTQWVNVHTGHPMHVEAIGIDIDGYPVADVGAGVSPYQVGLIYWMIQPDRALIEHAAQIAQPQIQAQWALHHLEFEAKNRNKYSVGYLKALSQARKWETCGLLQAEQITAIIARYFGSVQLTLF